MQIEAVHVPTSPSDQSRDAGQDAQSIWTSKLVHCTHLAPMLLLAFVGQPPIQTTCRYLHVVSDARACAQLPSFTLAVPCRRSFHFVRTPPSFLVALRTSGVCAVADEMRTCRNVRLDWTGLDWMWIAKNRCTNMSKDELKNRGWKCKRKWCNADPIHGNRKERSGDVQVHKRRSQVLQHLERCRHQGP